MRSRLAAFVAPVLAVMMTALVVSVSVYNTNERSGADAAAVTDDHHADTAASSTSEENHGTPAVVAPVPYDPTKPIDLGGVEGVTAEQQAAAEDLVELTLADLPHFADPKTAEAEGYFSIKDGFTGVEHYINWNYINDEHSLNPKYPESLVYDTTGPQRKLVSAMFMLEEGKTLDDVPELGGPLTQWHIHDNLCFTPDPVQPRIVGITNGEGECAAPTTKFTPVPMIHVWITPHRCGPFAALEGIGAGQIAEGEERLCDEAHGHED